jgi:hypothetical protein
MMIPHSLLPFALGQDSSSTQEETVKHLLRFTRVDMTLEEHCYANAPLKRYGRIVKVEKSIRVPKVILCKNYVFRFLAQDPQVHAPAFYGHVNIDASA